MTRRLKGVDTTSMLQDLKTNRKVQGALVLLVLLIWFLWPSSPSGPARPGMGTRKLPAQLGDRQAHELARLPDLSHLNKAGELPSEDRMFRDLFTFQGPPPPPPPAPKPPPPPPPPTPAQLAAQRLAAERSQESSSKPTNLRYLGYLGPSKGSRYGAFMKGEEPVTFKQGDLVSPKWRLVKVEDAFAEFQNLKFADIKHRVEATETRTGPGTVQANEF